MSGIGLQIFLAVNTFVLGALVATIFLLQRARKKTVDKKPQKTLLPHATWQKIVTDTERDYKKTIAQSASELQRELRNNTNALHKKATGLSLKIINDEFGRYKNDISKIHRENTLLLQQSAKEVTNQGVELRKNLISKQAKVEVALQEQQSNLENQLLKHGEDLNIIFQKREVEFLQRIDELEEKITTSQNSYLERQAVLMTEIEDTAKQRKVQRINQIDSSLNDTVSALLIENLGINVDLGAQLPHLLKTLEDNRDEIKKELR